MLTEEARSSSASPRELLDALALFMRASESLEDVHGRLLGQIQHLSEEVEAANRQLRESLNETERMRCELLHILECQPNGVWVLDRDGRTVHVNQRTLELLQLDMRGKCPQLSDLREAEDIKDFVRSSLQSPTPLEPRAFAFSPSGSRFSRHLTVAVSPLPNRNGTGTGTIVVIHDNTFLKRLEEEHHRNERLTAMGALAGQLAHEIRNPLNSIGLFASLLEETGGQDPSQLKWCQEIQDAVEILNNLVGNMLNLARPIDPGLVCLELGSFLSPVFESIRSLAAQNGICFELRHDAIQGYVQGDPDLLRQLVLNLALHALQSMPGGGKLRISSRVYEDETQGKICRLTVADTGVGIAEELLPRLFQPDFSVRQGGNGFGLWIVGQIVERLGGDIQVSSRAGMGTEFIVQIPCIETEKA